MRKESQFIANYSRKRESEREEQTNIKEEITEPGVGRSGKSDRMWDCESLAATDKSSGREGEEISYLTLGEKTGEKCLEEGGKGLLAAPFLLDLDKKKNELEFLVYFVPGRMGENAPVNRVSLFHLLLSPRLFLCLFLLLQPLSFVTVHFHFLQRASQRAPFHLSSALFASHFSFSACYSSSPVSQLLPAFPYPCPYTGSPSPLLSPFQANLIVMQMTGLAPP